jgi:excisionase family DNA binding protein
MTPTTEVHERPTVAQRLKISIRKLDYLIQEKKIKTLRIGKRRLISEEALQDFIRKAEKAAG